MKISAEELLSCVYENDLFLIDEAYKKVDPKVKNRNYVMRSAKTTLTLFTNIEQEWHYMYRVLKQRHGRGDMKQINDDFNKTFGELKKYIQYLGEKPRNPTRMKISRLIRQLESVKNEIKKRTETLSARFFTEMDKLFKKLNAIMKLMGNEAK